MKRIFVSGPYTAKNGRSVEDNIKAASDVAFELWRKGWAVFCPHKNTSNFEGLLPDKVWYDGDLSFLGVCDAILMMPNWSQSIGACGEHDAALKLGLTIYYDIDDVPVYSLGDGGQIVLPFTKIS